MNLNENLRFFVFFLCLVVFFLVFRGTWVSNLSPGLKLANRRDFTAEAKKVFRRLIIGKDNSESNFFHNISSFLFLPPGNRKHSDV